MFGRVAWMLLPLVAPLLQFRLPQDLVSPMLVLVPMALMPFLQRSQTPLTTFTALVCRPTMDMEDSSLLEVSPLVKPRTAWPWTTSSGWPAGRPRQRLPVPVAEPSLSSSSLSGLMFQISGALEVQQRLSQSCCQTVPLQGPTLDCIGQRTQMSASRASSMVTIRASMAPWLHVCACGVSPQKASRPCVLCSFGVETTLPIAVVSISAHVWLLHSLFFAVASPVEGQGKGSDVRRSILEMYTRFFTCSSDSVALVRTDDLQDLAVILKEFLNDRDELSAKRGVSTGRGRGALGRGGRGTSTGSADDG